MDAFFASVEIRDNPILQDKPLIIGALPNERGVVSTCNYEARKYGIHSAMNIKEAYYLCPNGIFMRPDIKKYRAISHQLHEIWKTYASAAEPIALDEAYLDITLQAGNIDGARRIAKKIKQRTLDELGLTCSIGVAYSKSAAKTASEEKKPNGYFEIPTRSDFVNLIINRDVSVIFTVGIKTAKKLHSVGIHTVRDIQNNKDYVIKMFGKQGRLIVDLSFGIDNREVVTYRPQDAKSIGREITFQKDVNDMELLQDVLLLLVLYISNRLKSIGLKGSSITLKISYADMKTITRSRTIIETDSILSIYNEALQLLNHIIINNPIRLLGISIHNLSYEEERQLCFDFFMDDSIKNQASILKNYLKKLNERYKIDFVGNYEKIYQVDTLHKTVEYMRKFKNRPANINQHLK